MFSLLLFVPSPLLHLLRFSFFLLFFLAGFDGLMFDGLSCYLVFSAAVCGVYRSLQAQLLLGTPFSAEGAGVPVVPPRTLIL